MNFIVAVIMFALGSVLTKDMPLREVFGILLLIGGSILWSSRD